MIRRQQPLLLVCTHLLIVEAQIPDPISGQNKLEIQRFPACSHLLIVEDVPDAINGQGEESIRYVGLHSPAHC